MQYGIEKIMPLTKQKHYTVGYHDTAPHHYEICEYAMSAYDAIEHSKEDDSYLKEHPHSIDYCVTEEVNKISNLMASGIPMGH